MALNTVNTILATIQSRRGAEEKFDPDQMTAGEWAVSTDSKKVWMCFRPGLVRRMATYEAFEEDMLEIQQILATCQDIQVAVKAFENLAEQHKNDAAASAELAKGFSDLSKSYAIGTDGEVRENDDIDNSKYYYEQSKRLTQGFNGIVPMGTIPFSDLDNPENQVAKYMFNISDAFTSDSRFKDGGGKYYDVGTNVVRTADDMWDALASSSDQSVVFSEAATRTNIKSGEKLSVMFGKIKKWLFDLKPVAFSNSYIDLDDKPSIPTLTNNLLTTEPGTALDAVQGKVLDDKTNNLNPIKQFYDVGVQDNIDSDLNSLAFLQEHPNGVFGHSVKLQNSVGFWVNVISYSARQYNQVSQIAFGEKGIATRYLSHSTNQWSDWVLLNSNLQSQIDQINSDLEWKQISIPNVSISGNIYTYNIDLSKYKEIYISIFLENYNPIDERMIVLGHFHGIYYLNVITKENYEISLKVECTKSKIVINVQKNNFPSINVPSIGTLYAR